MKILELNIQLIPEYEEFKEIFDNIQSYKVTEYKNKYKVEITKGTCLHLSKQQVNRIEG
jgi:hypothetical protein